jgi:RNA polymerase sigma factor (sigma-70 family)
MKAVKNSMPSQARSSDLSELLGAGANQAAEELAGIIRSLLNRLAARYRIAAIHREDLIQDVLTICLEQAYKIQRGQADPLENRDAWLSRVTYHAVLGLGRKLSRRRQEQEWPEDFTPPSPQPISPEDRLTLRKAWILLDHECRRLLIRRDVMEEERHHIAEELGINSNTLGVRLHRCRKKLLDLVCAA